MRSKVEEMIDDPNKGAKLATKVADAERALEETKAKWEGINESIDKETAAFHATTNADFSRGLREHIEQQVAFEEAQQAQWRELLRVFEAVPSTMPGP